jgi:hypothetical protein
MTEDPTVDLEEPGEIDWLRESRRGGQSGITEAELQDTEGLLQSATVEGEADDDEVDEVFSDFMDEVNMSVSEIRDWGDHDCSDKASVKPQEVRDRVVNLLETDKGDWGQAEVDAANRVISFVSRMRGMEQGEGTEDCPSDRDISLMNWGYRPDGVDL